MADRIVLMNHGELQQVAAARASTRSRRTSSPPASSAAPKINLIPGSVLRKTGSSVAVSRLSCDIPVNGSAGEVLRNGSADELLVGFRPEEIRPTALDAADLPVVTGTVEVIEPLGPETHVVVRVGEETLTCKFPPGRASASAAGSAWSWMSRR